MKKETQPAQNKSVPGIRRIVPNISTNKMEESRAFYAGFLGLKVAMDMGWIITLVSPDNPTSQISLVEESKPAAPYLSLSIEVADVDSMYKRANEMLIPIVYPITNEEWGVRRFFVQDPNGVVINLLGHLQ